MTKEPSQQRAQTERTIVEAFAGTQEVIDSIREAVFIADADDRTEWQRGYRACAELVVATLDQWDENGMAQVTRDEAVEYLARAQGVLIQYNRAELISDEAELLRGCLFALVSIARQMYDAEG